VNISAQVLRRRIVPAGRDARAMPSTMDTPVTSSAPRAMPAARRVL
jgi:hypothetical protein